MLKINTGKQLGPCKGLIYGPEGVGKSWLAANLPGALFIDVESGTGEMDVARTETPESWAHLLQIVGQLAANPMGYQTLVIDTADWAERLAIQQVCATNGFSSLGGQNDFGKSYNELAEIWAKFLNQLQADLIAPGKMHVVFLAHSTTKKHELPEEEGAYDRYMLKLEKKTAPLLMEWCSLVLFTNYKTMVSVDTKTKKAKGQGGTRRVMYSQHTAAYDAKNRFQLPAEMDMEYKHIAPCFANLKSQPAAPAPAAAPKPEAALYEAVPVAPEPASSGLSQPKRALQKMMSSAGVSYEDVLAVVVARGQFPAGTPLEALPDDFVEGWISHNWPKVLEFINKQRQ